MDKFTSMNALRAVAHSESFASAARKLGISRSQVNRLVIQLEDHLGVSLFHRSTRNVQLTPAGKAYLPRVEALLADLEDAERMLQGEQDSPKGEIRINAPMSFGTMYLSKVIVAFMQRYPQIRVQLVLSDSLIDPLAQGFDMTLRIAKPSEQSSMIEHEIVSIRRILCAAPAFINAHPGIEQPKDLKRLPCLHYGNLATGNRWQLNGPNGENSVEIHGTLCSNNGEVLCEAATAGLGIILMPMFIVGNALKQGRLVQVLKDYEASPLSLNLFYSPNRHLSERIRVFVKFMQEAFGEHTPWE